MYWVTSNVISLGQSALFRVPSVRKWLKLPDMAVLRAATTGGLQAGKPIVTFAQPPRPKKAKRQGGEQSKR